MRKSLRERLPALVLLATAGCGGDAGPSLTLDVRIAASLGPYGLCVPSEPDQLPHLPIDPSNVTQVRLTVLAPPGPSTPERFVCDRVIAVGGGNETEILIPNQSPVVDLIVEAYGAPQAAGSPPVVRFSGEQRGVKNGGGAARMFLIPPLSFGCTPGPMAEPRAFPAAALLPDGTVLVSGGLHAITNPTHTHLSASTSFELYDPATRSFAAVMDQRPTRLPRAFHELVPLGVASDGTVPLLLIGGLSPLDGSDGTAVVALRTGQEPLRIAPLAGLAGAADVEILTYNPAARTVSLSSQLPSGYHPRMFAAVAANLPSVLMVGGAMAIGANGFSGDRSIQQGDGATGAPLLSMGQTGMLAADRIGATATTLSATNALVFGGDLNVAAMAEAQNAAELVTGIPGSLVTATATFAGAKPVATAFHTATRTPSGQVLVVGGFVVVGGGAAGGVALDNNTTQPLQLLTVGGSAASVTSAAPADFTPVGYHQATLLDDAKALLVTGGNPTGGDNGCAPLECAAQGAYLIDPATMALSWKGALAIARYGHRQVQLGDGTALVLGGLRNSPALQDQGTIVLADAELFNPHDQSFDRANTLVVPARRQPGQEAEHTDQFPRCLTRDEFKVMHP